MRRSSRHLDTLGRAADLWKEEATGGGGAPPLGSSVIHSHNLTRPVQLLPRSPFNGALTDRNDIISPSPAAPQPHGQIRLFPKSRSHER